MRNWHLWVAASLVFLSTVAVRAPVAVAGGGGMAVRAPVAVAGDGRMAVRAPIAVAGDGRMTVRAPVAVAGSGGMAVRAPIAVAGDGGMTVRTIAAFAGGGGMATFAQSEVPFGSEETLRYAVNWPSGLSLGECELTARLIEDGAGGPSRWNFQFRLDAAVPGFRVLDDYRSSASAALCSAEFQKDSSHGKKKAREKTSFDAAAGVATRVTLGGGGESKIPVPACPRDGLTFLYHLRSELSHGRLPAAQMILFGAPYEISVEYMGSQSVRVGEGTVEADRLRVTVKGPASKHTFEISVARDAARTPVRVKVPLELGDFSMELVP